MRRSEVATFGLEAALESCGPARGVVPPEVAARPEFEVALAGLVVLIWKSKLGVDSVHPTKENQG